MQYRVLFLVCALLFACASVSAKAASIKADSFNGVSVNLPDRWQAPDGVVNGPYFSRVKLLDKQGDANLFFVMIDPEPRFAGVDQWATKDRIEFELANYASGTKDNEKVYFGRTVVFSKEGTGKLGSGETVSTRSMEIEIDHPRGKLKRDVYFSWFECGTKKRWCLTFVYNTPRQKDQAAEFATILKSITIPATQNPTSRPTNDILSVLPGTSWTISWGGPHPGQTPVAFSKNGAATVASFPGNFVADVTVDEAGRIRFKNRMGFELVVMYRDSSHMDGNLIGPSWQAPAKLEAQAG